MEKGEWEWRELINLVILYLLFLKPLTMLQLAHKKLDVYAIALNLTKEIYELTKSFPKEEQFVLISQLRRAAVSVCSNLAEGSPGFLKLIKEDSMKYHEVLL